MKHLLITLPTHCRKFMMKIAVAVVLAVSLVVLLQVMDSATLASADSFTITNWFTNAGEFDVDCGSNVGRKTLDKGEVLGYEFRENLWRHSWYNCAFRWGKKTQQFTVWTDDDNSDTLAKHKPCEHCNWRVTENGFFRNNYGTPGVWWGVHQWLG